MKKNVLMIIGIIAFMLIIVALSFFPKFLSEYEKKSNQIVKNNCKVITAKILETKGDLAKEDVKNIVEILNETFKNPISSKFQAFVFDTEKCMGCVNVNFDENIKSATIAGYNKDLKLLCRAVIKPPSYVTYESEE